VQVERLLPVGLGAAGVIELVGSHAGQGQQLRVALMAAKGGLQEPEGAFGLVQLEPCGGADHGHVAVIGRRPGLGQDRLHVGGAAFLQGVDGEVEWSVRGDRFPKLLDLAAGQDRARVGGGLAAGGVEFFEARQRRGGKVARDLLPLHFHRYGVAGAGLPSEGVA